MKKRVALTIFALNLLALAASVTLIFLVRQDMGRTMAAYQEFYAAARLKANTELWRLSIEESQPARALMSTAFIGRGSLIRFIEELEALARTNEIELNLSEPSFSGESLRLSIGVKGAFSKIGRFLIQLENLPYALTIEQLSLSASGSDWVGSLAVVLVSFDDEDN